MSKRHLVEWIDRKAEPTIPFNRNFPNGMELDNTKGELPACLIKFPMYPTPRNGWWSIVCKQCGLTAIVTTAGRVDDPVSVMLACRKTSAV